MIQFPGPPHPNGMESPYTYSHTYFCNTIHYTRLHYITLHYTTLHYITGMHATSSYRQTGMHTYIGGTEASEQIWVFLVIISACCILILVPPIEFLQQISSCAVKNAHTPSLWPARPQPSGNKVKKCCLSTCPIRLPEQGQGLASTSELLSCLCRMLSLQSMQCHMMNDPRLRVANQVVAATFACTLDI